MTYFNKRRVLHGLLGRSSRTAAHMVSETYDYVKQGLHTAFDPKFVIAHVRFIFFSDVQQAEQKF